MIPQKRYFGSTFVGKRPSKSTPLFDKNGPERCPFCCKNKTFAKNGPFSTKCSCVWPVFVKDPSPKRAKFGNAHASTCACRFKTGHGTYKKGHSAVLPTVRARSRTNERARLEQGCGTSRIDFHEQAPVKVDASF